MSRGKFHASPFLVALLVTTSLVFAQAAEIGEDDSEAVSFLLFSGGGRTDRVDLPYVNAVRWEDCPDRYGMTVYLTSEPIDLATLAQGEMDPDNIIRPIDRKLRGPGKAFGVVKIFGDGSPRLMFSRTIWILPEEGELTIETHNADRIAGSGRSNEARKRGGKLIEFELRFDAQVSDVFLAGEPLSEGGGEPGATFQQHIEAVAAGDMATLRRVAHRLGHIPESDEDREAIDKLLASLRRMTPTSALVTRGTVRHSIATLSYQVPGAHGLGSSGLAVLQRDEQGWSMDEIRPCRWE